MPCSVKDYIEREKKINRYFHSPWLPRTFNEVTAVESRCVKRPEIGDYVYQQRSEPCRRQTLLGVTSCVDQTHLWVRTKILGGQQKLIGTYPQVIRYPHSLIICQKSVLIPALHFFNFFSLKGYLYPTF